VSQGQFMMPSAGQQKSMMIMTITNMKAQVKDDASSCEQLTALEGELNSDSLTIQ